MTTTTLNKERLTECRKKLGITKIEAAKRMNMAQPTYVRYESGDRSPAIHVIQTMADVLGTSVAYLTDQSDNPAPDTYVVSSSNDNELFFLIEQYKSSDRQTQEKLLAYARSLSE